MKKNIFLLILFFSLNLNSAEPAKPFIFSAAPPAGWMPLGMQQPKKVVKTPLQDAIESGNLQEIEKLLQHGVQDSAKAFYYLVCAMDPKNAMLNFQQAEQIGANLRILYGLDINHQIIDLELGMFKDRIKATPLYAAASLGNVLGVKLLIELGADVNKQDEISKSTPLLVGTKSEMFCQGSTKYTRELEIFNLLINAGADINLQNSLGYTILSKNSYDLDKTTYFEEKIEIMKIMLFKLLLLGADTTLYNYKKETFFDHLQHPATLKVAQEFIKYILEAEGVDEIKGAQNALLIAAYLNEPNLVNALLRKGVWFNSEKYKQYFNNLIADKPEIHAIVQQYKLERGYVISQIPELIPDISNIVVQY